MLNKSTAFTDLEREEFGLTGLLPETVELIELQLKCVFIQLGHKLNNIDRYIYLMNLLDHNETLFYKTLMSNPAYFLPIIYAPTIGEACLKFEREINSSIIVDIADDKFKLNVPFVRKSTTSGALRVSFLEHNRSQKAKRPACYHSSCAE